MWHFNAMSDLKYSQNLVSILASHFGELGRMKSTVSFTKCRHVYFCLPYYCHSKLLLQQQHAGIFLFSNQELTINWEVSVDSVACYNFNVLMIIQGTSIVFTFLQFYLNTSVCIESKFV